MSLTEEESNFLRFYYLNLKVSSNAVRVYFDSVHPPVGLAGELANISAYLKSLRFITKQQLQTLYQSSGSNVKSDDFDTTLIVCLLRNMPPRESAPVTGWDNLPNLVDTSSGADLARIKWYRNQLAHHSDGKLSSTDFCQYWGDLQDAIGRLGGSSLLMEAKSAKNIILDRSLTHILNLLQNYERYVDNIHETQEQHTDKISSLQTAIDNQRTVKKQHDNLIQQLHDSLHKVDTEAQKLATELSYHKGSIQKCTEAIEEFKKKKEHLTNTIEELQEKLQDNQKQVDDFTRQLFRLECKYNKTNQETDDKLVTHDEQLANHEREINDIKKKKQNTEYTSGRQKQERLEDITNALILEDIREGTFVTTNAVTSGFNLLMKNSILLITGHAGTGKSRIGRHILHMIRTESMSYKCIKLNSLEEWNDMVSRKDNVVILLDDMFGETNCIYNRERDTPILDIIYADVCESNIKVIITIRDTVKRQCSEVFVNHRLFKFDSIDLSSEKFELKLKEKTHFLINYMKTFRQADFVEGVFVDSNGDRISKSLDVLNITLRNHVKGFPLQVYQFVNNDKYFHLGSKFFDRPTEIMLDEMNAIRRNGEDHSKDKKKFMIQYAVMVYTAINENCINPEDKTCVTEIPKIIDAIYGETIKLKKCQILDAVTELKGSFLVNMSNQRSYRFHHQTLQESVILSFAQIDDENINKIIPLISWSFFEKMVKSESFNEKEGEVVLRIPENSYKCLADRLVDEYMAEFRRNGIHEFLQNLIETEIFQQGYSFLIPSFLEGLEKEDRKDEHMDNMIGSDENYCHGRSYFHVHMKKKDISLALLLYVLAKTKGQLDIYNFTLKTFKQIITTGNYLSTINYMEDALVMSLYEICSTKDVQSVSATLDIVEENKIPVLLDQGINPRQLHLHYRRFTACYDRDIYCNSTTCVFLSFCVRNAYNVFNVSVLDFLLSKYNDTQFDVNLFLEMIYRNNWFDQETLSHKPLKWIINRFIDQECIDTDFIFIIACKLHMFDTAEYLVSRCTSIDAFSCLKTAVDGHRDCLDSFQSKNAQAFINFLFTKINITSKDLVPVAMSVFKKHVVPDYLFDAFLPVCLNDAKFLSLACSYGHFYVVKKIIENSNIQLEDIQSALISVCSGNESHSGKATDHMRYVKVKKLEIVKYLIQKFGSETFDLQNACKHACDSHKFKIVDWFLQSNHLSAHDADIFLLALSLKSKNLPFMPNETEIITKKYTFSSKKMEKLAEFNTMWTNEELNREIGNTAHDNKSLELLMWLYENYNHRIPFDTKILLESAVRFRMILVAKWILQNFEQTSLDIDIVNTAYQQCLDLLMWIHENCKFTIDGKRLLMTACEYLRVDVAKWVVQTFDQATLNTDGRELFLLACGPSRFSTFDVRKKVLKRVDTINWILATFQIQRLDIFSGVSNLIRIHLHRNELFKLVVSILEKFLSCLNEEEKETFIHESIKHDFYDLVNWFLENDSWLNKQTIMDKACTHANIKTIEILSKYFCSLNMNKAMIYVCTSHFNKFRFENYTDDKSVACLSLLWKEINEIDHNSIDISTIVRTVCKEDAVSDNVMTWILLNLPLDQIPINEVLITCCKQRKIKHVKYIFYVVDNEKLHVKEALVQTCQPVHQGMYQLMLFNDLPMKDIFDGRMLLDYLFQKSHDKESDIRFVLNALLYPLEYEVKLYFLQAGFCKDIDMKSLLNKALLAGHVRLVKWIVTNVDHTDLDIKSAFHKACHGIKHGRISLFKERVNQIMCVALLWHYIHDINMFEIDTVLKTMTESQSGTSEDSLKIWLLYIKKLKRRIYQSDKTLLNTGETIHQQSQQVINNDGQCCLEDSQ